MLKPKSKFKMKKKLTFKYKNAQKTRLPTRSADKISPRWSYTIAGLNIPNLYRKEFEKHLLK